MQMIVVQYALHCISLVVELAASSTAPQESTQTQSFTLLNVRALHAHSVRDNTARA